MASAPLNSPSPTILVVDDDRVTRIVCSSFLQQSGYKVVMADSVAAARRLIEENGILTISAIVSDYRMPDEDGLALLAYISKVDPNLSVVMMTTDGERQFVMHALREGAHNVIDKPLEKVSLAAAAAEAIKATAKARAQAAEAESARSLGQGQSQMLGSQIGSARERLKLFFQPHSNAGGDFAAVINLRPGRFVLLLSDVSGHDLKAAVHSAYLQGFARGLLSTGASIEETFAGINSLLMREWNTSGISLSIAASAIDFDLDARAMRVMNAGLPAPIRSDAKGHAVFATSRDSSPLGWFEDLDPACEMPEETSQVLLWSDGLPDAAEALGVSDLALAHRLLTDPEAGELLKTAALDDVIVARLDLRPLPGSPLATPLYHRRFKSGDHTLIDSIQEDIERNLRFALPKIGDIPMLDSLLCLREALLNALQHGAGSSPDGWAELDIGLSSDGGFLHLKLVDSGPGHQFDIDKHEVEADEQLLTEHRGLILLKHMGRNLLYHGCGNHMTLDLPIV